MAVPSIIYIVSNYLPAFSVIVNFLKPELPVGIVVIPGPIKFILGEMNNL
jgi:hypothetical protein